MHSRCHLSIRIWDLLGVLGFKGGAERRYRENGGEGMSRREGGSPWEIGRVEGGCAMGDREGRWHERMRGFRRRVWLRTERK
jgi:hypothetical protein